MDESINHFIPAADVQERHEILVRAPAKLVFDVAESLDLLSIPLVRAIFWLRSKLLRSSGRPAQGLALRDQMSALGWGVLTRTPGRELVAGAVTQPWLPDVTFQAVAPERFATFAEPDLVKISWTLEAEPLGPALTRFRTQTRVVATDDAARRKFRAYWRLFSLGILLIRRLIVRAVRREAERRYGQSNAPALPDCQP